MLLIGSGTTGDDTMKYVILAAGLLALGTSNASAQAWHRDHHPYARHHHATCLDKAARLHQYERRSARDGIITPSERRTIRALESDLARTCGGFRHRGH
jgi:hypothetical protein